MSAGYNDRLTPLAWKGECGDKETEEARSKWLPKAAELAQWIRNSKHTVVFTGAGISCASGIPDFRGPNGVWTLEKKGLKPECNVSFEDARPSFTHYALVALMERGLLHYVVTQNVDNLHIKSGIPRDKLSELHGNIFAEHCDKCDTEYIRNFDVRGMGCKPTGRFCDNAACGGALRDKTIDWNSSLPDAEFERAIAHHQQADLALCLGTSLRIRPAGNMPLRTLRKHKKDAPGRLVIVNLQKTHLDRSASMRLHVRTDALFRELCKLLDVHVKEDDAAAAADASAAAAAEDAQHAAAAAAARPPPPRKAKSATPPRSGIGRPTRDNTQRLRQLYNPTAAGAAEEGTLEGREDDGSNEQAHTAATSASASDASLHAAAAAATSWGASPAAASASASPATSTSVKRQRDSDEAAEAGEDGAPSSKWPRASEDEQIIKQEQVQIMTSEILDTAPQLQEGPAQPQQPQQPPDMQA